MNTKPILYDLGVSLGAISLWLTPFDATRLLGYCTSLVFAADAYYRGVCLLSKEKREDEIEGIKYEASVDFYDQLLGSQIDSYLEVKALEIETATIKKLIPLLTHKRALERELEQVSPTHPEMSEEEREEAAKSAIDSVFTTSKEVQPVTEEEIRKHFPESMDVISWKAILKALQNGATKKEAIRDVLGCSESTERIGAAYFLYLKEKYLG